MAGAAGLKNILLEKGEKIALFAGGGIAGFESFYDFADIMSPLGNASAEECADYVITLFSDLTRKVTMQNLFHDGGYSMTGISAEVLEMMGNKL